MDKMDQILAAIEHLSDRVAAVESRLGSVEAGLSGVAMRQGLVERHLEQLGHQMATVDRKVSAVARRTLAPAEQRSLGIHESLAGSSNTAASPMAAKGGQ